MNASVEQTIDCIALLFNILLTAADDHILHKAVTPPTCNRTDPFPSLSKFHQSFLIMKILRETISEVIHANKAESIFYY